MAGIETTGAQRPAEREVTGGIVIRRITQATSWVPHPSPTGDSAIGDMRKCVELQQEVWGFTDIELVPLRLFVVADKIGGQVIGAFHGSQMVGFAMAIPGIREGHTYLHSHMLAVRPEYRNKGLGRAIKIFQRDDALSYGIDLIEWTFDPLEIKNAYLNLEKLGAIARRYNVNQYGITTSPLQGGLPTDRLVAEWWLKSDRVRTTIETGAHPPIKIEMNVSIPAEVYEWKKSPETRAKAMEVQTHAREELLRAFNDGLACVGYERDETGNGEFLLANLEMAEIPSIRNPEGWNSRVQAFALTDQAIRLQLSDGSLTEIQKLFERAAALDPGNIDILQEAAHFFDAVMPDEEKARNYATLCRERARKIEAEMNGILIDQRDGHL